jgi:hypothetical protein
VAAHACSWCGDATDTMPYVAPVTRKPVGLWLCRDAKACAWRLAAKGLVPIPDVAKGLR